MATLENKPSLGFFKEITDDFSDQRLLGTGSFGSVYKGILEDGRVFAVKKLGVNAPVPHKDVFDNELKIFRVLEHENIVKLVASCRESNEKSVSIDGRCITANITETVLCYEYFRNGSLDKHIFGDSNTLGWNTRFEIIKGISNGIQYLHSLPTPVWHLGLKPQNILLDGSMVPKIGDFVFSRIFDHEISRKTTISQVGTVGYMAPEYVEYGEISPRSDIYSLGLIILEMVTREKNSSGIDQKHAEDYIDEVEEKWDEEKILAEYDEELDYDGICQVTACLEIGRRCVNNNQIERPSIQEIVDKLSGQ